MIKGFVIFLLCGATGALIGCTVWLIYILAENPYHPADRLYYFKLFAGFFSFVGLLLGAFLAFAMSSREAELFPSIACVIIGAMIGIGAGIAVDGEKSGHYVLVCMTVGAAIGSLYYRRAIKTHRRR